MIFSIIVAVDTQLGIGKDNQLLWHLPNDLKWFKTHTTGKSIIMGRKTYQSIGKPLPNRRNIVLSRQENLKIEGCEIYKSLDKVIENLSNEDEVFIIGGGDLYRQTIALAHRIYITRVEINAQADTHFPDMDMNQWVKIFEELHPIDEKNKYSHTFQIFERLQ